MALLIFIVIFSLGVLIHGAIQERPDEFVPSFP